MLWFKRKKVRFQFDQLDGLSNSASDFQDAHFGYKITQNGF